MTQVPVQVWDQRSCRAFLPHTSPGVQGARDAESLTPQTTRAKDAVSGAMPQREGPQKPLHSLPAAHRTL